MAKTITGLGLWVMMALGVGGAISALSETDRQRARETARDVARFFSEGATTVAFRVPGFTPLLPSDGVLRLDGARLHRIGQVVNTESTGAATLVWTHLDPWEADTLTTRTHARLFASTGSAAWVASTLLPPETRQKIVDEWERFLSAYETELTDALVPLASSTLEEMAGLLGSEIASAVDHFRPQIAHLLASYRREIVEEKLVPLVHDEVWSIIKQRGTGPATLIGRELWEEAPLWGFFWRGVWDSLAHDTPVSIEQRWREFVEESALPILTKHSDLMEETASLILQDILENQKVLATLEQVMFTMRDDPRLHGLLREMANHVIQDSPRVRIYIGNKLRDPHVLETLKGASRRLQEFVDRAVNLIVLNPAQDGINRDMARLLRTMVLGKDRHWLLVETPPGGRPLEASQSIPVDIEEGAGWFR